MQTSNPDFGLVIIFGLLIVFGPFLAMKALPPMSRGSDGIPVVVLLSVALILLFLFKA
jgi:hypothetical protein